MSVTQLPMSMDIVGRGHVHSPTAPLVLSADMQNASFNHAPTSIHTEIWPALCISLCYINLLPLGFVGQVGVVFLLGIWFRDTVRRAGMWGTHHCQQPLRASAYVIPHAHMIMS